jgi:hypothetical protein
MIDISSTFGHGFGGLVLRIANRFLMKSFVSSRRFTDILSQSPWGVE